jgi:hypothetical protein
MLIIRPCHFVTNQGVRTRMKAGKGDDLGPGLLQLRIQGALKGFAVLAVEFVIDGCCRNACRSRRFEPLWRLAGWTPPERAQAG